MNQPGNPDLNQSESLNLNSEASRDACICAKGFEPSGADGCTACAVGSYKDFEGNDGQCIVCPENYTTYAVGAISNSSCYEETPVAGSGSGSGDLQSSATVPAISFSFSIGQIPATEDPETLRAQLIAAWQRSLNGI